MKKDKRTKRAQPVADETNDGMLAREVHIALSNVSGLSSRFTKKRVRTMRDDQRN